MSSNIEIKARVHDFSQLKSTIEATCGQHDSLLMQKDIFYRLRKYRLKLRYVNGNSELILYKREDSSGPKQSSYLRMPIAFPRLAHSILRTVLGVRGIVEKKRTLFFSGNTRIHLDEVKGLGTFLEFEVVLGKTDTPSDGVEKADKLMNILEIQKEDLVAGAYIDLIEQRRNTASSCEGSR